MDPDYVAMTLRHALTKRLHNQVVRYARVQEGFYRDRILDSLRAGNCPSTFKTIKALRKLASSKIAKLHVGKKTFLGDRVPDGMY